MAELGVIVTDSHAKRYRAEKVVGAAAAADCGFGRRDPGTIDAAPKIPFQVCG